jgi:hypothetical protein
MAHLHRSRSAYVVAAIVLLGCTAAATIVAYSAATSSAGVDRVLTPIRSAATRDASPTATEFAVILSTATNQFGEANGESRRIRGVDCVKGAPADYMCSFEEVGPTGRRCRLAHLRHTPKLESTVTVLTAGRVGRCGTVREAFHSLP